MRWLAALAVLALSLPSASAPDPKAKGAVVKAGGVVRVEHHDPAALPAQGSSTALVTIELFFTPGQSSRVPAYKMYERLQAQHPSRIRLVYRIVSSGGAARLQRAALQAHAEGKFFEFMDALNTAKPTLNDKEVLELGKKIGLDPDRLYAAMTKPPANYEKVLEANGRRRKQRIHGNPPLPNALFNGLPAKTLTAAIPTATDLEREYRVARERAEELIDLGATPESLPEAFDYPARDELEEIAVTTGPTDTGGEVPEPMLATPPLDLRGLPSYGAAEAGITIAVLCSPISSNCVGPMIAASRMVQELYPDRVRVVWAPYFDVVAREDAAELSLLGDAALCAEKVGVTLEDRDESFGGDASPGWRWVEAVLSESNRRHVAPDKIIDKVVERLRVDRRAFATCRAQLAGATIAWIESARHAGVTVTPSTVVGGRIYGPIVDYSTLQLLVDAELAPGKLGEMMPPTMAR